MIEIQRRHHLLGQSRIGVVGNPHVVFLEHDVALGQHIFVLQNEAGHAVGLEFHHLAEVLARHALEIAGVIDRSEGVFVAADPTHGLGEFTGGMFGRALEHQMLKEMRQSRFARRLVGRADLVPEHLGDDGGTMIGDHHHLQAIAEGEAGGTLRRHRGLGQRAIGGKSECRNQDGSERNGKAMCGHHDLSGNPNPIVRDEAAASYTAAGAGLVTKARDELNYWPYLPWAGLYSLFSDSFGPVP